MFHKFYENLKCFIKDNYKFLLTLIFILFLFRFELPYVIYKKGGTIDLKDRVVIEKEYNEQGSFSMSYVTVIKGTIPFIALSYIMPDWDLVPIKDISTNNNYDETLKIGREFLQEGIDNAIMAAFKESNYNIVIKSKKYHVIYISEKAKTNLSIGDEILAVNGTNINNIDELKEYINQMKENDEIQIEVLHNNKKNIKKAKIYEDEDKSLKIGVGFKTVFDYETEIPISIKHKKNESGGSGGLMMGLAIYNALTDDDITKSLKIVGTGSINSDGSVEEIGGVKYKVLAAESQNADLFFCPKENYKEAIKIKEKRNLKVNIIGVKSLKEAIDYLNGI